MTRVLILDEVVYISHSVTTLRKLMNPNILSPVMGTIVGQTGQFNLGMATDIEGKL